MKKWFNQTFCSVFKQHNFYVVAITGDEESHIEECCNCKKLRKVTKKWVVEK